MKRLLILFSLLWTFNLFANIDLFKENTVECAIEEVAEVLRNQTQTLKLVVTGELKDNSHWTQLTEAVRAREKFINLDLSKLKGLTKVGGFSECEKLAAITLPDCVTTIDNAAFTQCSFKSIKIPNNVTSIGDWAFKSCSLRSITIPDSVTTIKTYAFAWSGLESVTIGSGVTHFGFGVFSKCQNLKNVVISEGTTNIGESAFANCYNLTNISIPNSITYIGESAFSRCNKLIHSKYNNGFYLGNKNNPYVVLTTIDNKTVSSFYINENTKVIYNHSDKYLRGTFSDCNNLTSIVLPYGLTCIGSYIFSGCKNLTNIIIPDTVISIGYNAFISCNKLTYNKYNNGSYLGNKNNPYVVLVKAENSFTFDINKKTKIINNGAFKENRDLTSITIPDSVIIIGNSAFYQCTNLEILSIGKGVISIGGEAFYGCTGLTSITIPDSVITIGNGAFYQCDNLESLSIGKGVISIGDCAFYGCTGLTSIIIPDSVKSIGMSAFIKYHTMEWHPRLDIETIVIGNGLTSLDNLPITSALKSITIGSGITSIDNELFKYCENAKIYVSDLKSYLNNFSDNPRVELKIDSLPNDLVIPDGVTSIKSFAFKGHNNLTSVTIPDSVTSIGENAFSDCNNIKTLIVGNGLTSLDNLPITSALKFITIGSGINSINENAFNLCNDLTIFKVDENNQNYSASEDKKILFNKDKTTLIAYPSAAGDITIPDGVTTITSNAFNGCSNLTNVTIPDSITSIENKAFEGCNSLTSVTFKDTNNWFYTTNSNYTDKMQIDVADTAQNATYLKDSYCNYYLYKYLETTITVTADNVTDGISKLSKGGNHTVKVTGEITADTIASIKTALNNNNCAKVNLDLSDTTGLTSIGWDAFRDCTNLTSVVIPDSVTSVGYNAFFNCNNIETLVIGNGLTSLNYLPITSALKSITIGNGINSINERTFNSCNNLTIFNVDENNQNYSVSEDGKILFNKDKTTLITCSSAANDVTIPDSVTTVNSGAFVNCKNVETLVIGNGLTSLDNLPIASSLKSITIGNNIKSIGNNAFRDCSSLTSVTIPDSVTEIGNYAFSGCNGLKNIRISKNVTKIKDYTFSNCSNLTSIAIPDSVTSIGNNAFKDCKSLTSVTIGSNVTSIGSWAFNGCSSLTSVVIPDGVAKIDSSAFFGCGNLTSVTFEDIKNWSVVISSGKKKKMNVKNVSKNATNLTQNYCGNEWIKE